MEMSSANNLQYNYQGNKSLGNRCYKLRTSHSSVVTAQRHENVKLATTVCVKRFHTMDDTTLQISGTKQVTNGGKPYSPVLEGRKEPVKKETKR